MNQIVFPNAIDVDFRETARSLGATVTFPVGATIFREGDPPDHMYIVLEGAIDVSHCGQVIGRSVRATRSASLACSITSPAQRPLSSPKTRNSR